MFRGKAGKAAAPPPPITPLPFFHVITVVLVQTSEGMNINVLFPFLAFMIEDMGYGGHKLGYYAGGLAASFCGAQFLSSYLWGKFSDHYGRKPAIIIGTLGSGLGMLVFGLAKTYSVAVLGRIISGLLCGNLGVLKSFLTEITDDSNRGLAFSYMSVAWNVGCLIAPITGGFLCKPATKYPTIFSADGVFGSYPYLLPCLVCATWNVVATISAYFTMEETRKTAHNCCTGRKSYASEDDAGNGDVYDSSDNTGLEMTTTNERVRVRVKGAYEAVSLSADEDAERALELSAALERAAAANAGDSDGTNGDDATHTAINAKMREGLLKGCGAASSSAAAAKGGYASVRPGDPEVDYDDEYRDDDGNTATINKFSIEIQCDDDEDDDCDNDRSSATFTVAENADAWEEEGEACKGCCSCCSRDGAPSPLKQATVLKAVGVYFLLAMAYILLDETIPLFLKLEHGAGGFGYDSMQIGTLLSISGAVMLLFTFFVLPRIARISKKKMFLYGVLGAIPSAAIWPLLAYITNKYMYNNDEYDGAADANTDYKYRLYVMGLLVCCAVAKAIMACLSFTAVMIQINHSVADEYLGAVNGLGQSLAALARSFGPAVGGLCFSYFMVLHKMVFFNFALFASLLVIAAVVNGSLPDSIDKKLVVKGSSSGGKVGVDIMH